MTEREDPMTTTGQRNPESGDRIRLKYTTDEYTKLEVGSLGWVTGRRMALDPYEIHTVETIDVTWDDGSTLSLIPSDGDRYEILGNLDALDEERADLIRLRGEAKTKAAEWNNAARRAQLKIDQLDKRISQAIADGSADR